MTDEDGIRWIVEALGLKEKDSLFPWQLRLYENLKSGQIPRLLDIPTGLGKTSVMALWLIARVFNPRLPRRLVYLVDRRAIVDQATEVAINLRNFVESVPEIKEKLGLEENQQFPISTLRGQFADNKEWLKDPISPGIIVGTLDMIGSRLLFEGYGVSRKMRPYHAAFLGTDVFFVLDEAHLVPPFEKLLDSIANNRSIFGPFSQDKREIIPPFEFMAMSATGKQTSQGIFSINDDDLKNPTEYQRLTAKKRITIKELEENRALHEVLAEEAWKLSNEGKDSVKIVVYCDKRRDAVEVKKEIRKIAKRNKSKIDVQLLVGARRVLERELVANWLKEHGFIARSDVEVEKPTFLIATSAGEVGVDLDADHMVSDLVPWERMVQRLGRVNRFGSGDANVIVIVGYDKKIKEEERKILENTRKMLEELPKENGFMSGSPLKLLELRERVSTNDKLKFIFETSLTPEPLRPALHRGLIDAWSMTTLKEHTGRPDIRPWLRGWIKDEPQVRIIWREYLPVRWKNSTRIELSEKEIEEFFSAAPPQLIEVLETELSQVRDWIKKRAKKLEPNQIIDFSQESESEALEEDDIIAVVLSPAGEFRQVWTLSDILNKRYEPMDMYAGCTIVFDRRVAGLTKDGLLDPNENERPTTIDEYIKDDEKALTLQENAPEIPFRIKRVLPEMEKKPDMHWRESKRFIRRIDDNDEPVEWLIIEERIDESQTEDSRSIGYLETLKKHTFKVKEKVEVIGKKLGLPKEYISMLSIAAEFHDMGKGTDRWQRAFNAPTDDIYAKTPGPVYPHILSGYRHEVGSLLMAKNKPEFNNLPDELRELALHLIAAHHGFARPLIPVDSCDDAPPSILKELSKEVALRFAKLEKEWGPWGLAWWESLLRAADHLASTRDNGGST